MSLGSVEIILMLAVPVIAWRAWLALFGGISLRSDYGVRGGWFGSPVTLQEARSSSGRYYAS